MQTAILYPVFAQIFMTFLLGVMTSAARVREVRSGRIHPSEIALDSSKWPDHARKLGNCFSNQFEIPVIFYVLCLIALQTRMADSASVVLAWGFVISRFVHAYIHATGNRVTRRGLAFLVGAIFLGLLAVYLFVRLLAAGI